MPMVSDIRRHYPDANIDWVVEEGYVSLVRLNPDVRRIIPFALRRWRKNLFSLATRNEMSEFRSLLRLEEYDLVFDTQGLLKTGIVMRMARLAPNGKRVGLANATEGSGYEPISRVFHTMSVAVGLRTHAVLRARQVAAKALGYSAEGPADFNLQMAGVASKQSPLWLTKQPYAVFFHGTARAEKQWAFDNWVSIARLLATFDLQVLLPWGSEDEKKTAEKMAEKMPNARVLPRLPLMEAVMLAQRAALVVGVDTGLTHVAAAFNRPTIELYCDSPRWKTEGDWSANIINLGDEGTSPTVDEVERAVHILLHSMDKIDASRSDVV